MLLKLPIKKLISHLLARDALLFAFCAFVSAAIFCLLYGIENIVNNLGMFTALAASPVISAMICYSHYDKGQNIFSYSKVFSAAALTALLNPALLIVIGAMFDFFNWLRGNVEQLNSLDKELGMFLGVEIIGAVIGFVLAIPGTLLFIAIQRCFFPSTKGIA